MEIFSRRKKLSNYRECQMPKKNKRVQELLRSLISHKEKLRLLMKTRNNLIKIWICLQKYNLQLLRKQIHQKIKSRMHVLFLMLKRQSFKNKKVSITYNKISSISKKLKTINFQSLKKILKQKLLKRVLNRKMKSKPSKKPMRSTRMMIS